MNTTIRNSWKSDLYLDAIGSSSVIAASVLIFLSVAVTALTEAPASGTQVVNACPTARSAAADYLDHPPAAAHQLIGTECA